MALESVELVPSSDVCADLVAAMARLVRQQGCEVFVSEPIFLPSREHFPERLRATTGSIRTLIRRLMAYALLDNLGVELHVYDSSKPYDEVTEDGRLLRPPHHAAAWYAGTREGVCQFGLDVRQLEDIEKLAGVLCHEVAHAFRDFHRLQVPTVEIEELLTDLTTVYLGFGVFTANNAYRYRSEGSMQGHSWREEKIGYLSPQALVFLLALQVAARGKREEELVRRQLELTQREMFGASLRLIDDHPELVEDLRLPPREEWPEPTSGAAIAKTVTSDLQKAGDDEPDEPIVIEERDENIDDEEASVFIVYENDSRLFALLGAAFGGILGALIGDARAIVVLTALCTVAGYTFGKRLVRGLCSNPDCHARLHADSLTCDGCGRLVEDNSLSEER